MTPEEARKLREKQDSEVKLALATGDKLKPNPCIGKAISQCEQVKGIAKAEG
jgi:hypothetical protein